MREIVIVDKTPPKTDTSWQSRTETEREIAPNIEIRTFADVATVYRRWLLLPDDSSVRIVHATLVANRMKGDPVWLFLLQSSGGTKTELIRPLSGVPGVYPLSDLTPRTLASGDRSPEASLLDRIHNGILTLKDFTTVLTKRHEDRQEILAQLREIYDGSYRKTFGNGKVVDWQGKVGVVAGVTPVLETHHAVMQVLGQRFIIVRITLPEPVVLAEKAIENLGRETEMRGELKAATKAFIEQLDIPQAVDLTPYRQRLANLATLVATARSAILRDGYRREVVLAPDPEIPTRLAKQLSSLQAGLAVLHGGPPTENDYLLTYKVAVDSIPSRRTKMLHILDEAESALTTIQIAGKAGYPTSTARLDLEDLTILGLLSRSKAAKQDGSDSWNLADKFRQYAEAAAPQVEGEGVFVNTTVNGA